MNDTTVRTYSSSATTTPGTTGTGLDQIVDWIGRDTGLAGSNAAVDVAAGASAADRLNAIIVEAATATGASADRVFTAGEVLAMNTWIRANRLSEWTSLHGDDAAGGETGFHQVQGDGSVTRFRGASAIDTVADGIYHLGFDVVDGQFLDQSGSPAASAADVAGWLTALYTDHSSTGTGLDRIVDMVVADAGLAAGIPQSNIAAGADAADAMNRIIAAGADAADAMNRIIADAVAATGVADDGVVSITDVRTINTWIRSQPDAVATWTALHGDDENGVETGFHLVQNDGATTPLFGANGVDTVADGIYHLGFEIRNSNLLNEDGDANATLRDMSNWLTYFFCDQSTTGTGLDRIVDVVMTDPGLMRWNYSVDTLAGAQSANGMNQIIVDAVAATGAMADGWITTEDIVAMNAWIRADATLYDRWVELHGDDGQEWATGYHLVQNDGADTDYFGHNLVDTVADGIYHLAFDIAGGHFVNEDGDQNASLSDVAEWLNYFVKGTPLVLGTSLADTIGGTSAGEEIDAGSGNDIVSAGTGADLIHGGWGNDSIEAGGGCDIIYAGWDNDTVDGGNAADIYRVSGNYAAGWDSFQGFDTYADSGTAGTDVIQVVGGNVDIGLTGFGPGSGIEIIDARQATGAVRLLADWHANLLDFRATKFLGRTMVIDGGDGNDTIYGSVRSDVAWGGGGNDILNLAAGSDVYRVSGNYAAGWESFQGFDTYADDGTSGTDTIQAIGSGDVDIGLTRFTAASGIEVVDASSAAGTVRLLGDWNANRLDFRATTMVGGNIVIDAGYGNDTVLGSAANDAVWGGGGDDWLNLGAGSDVYRVSGNYAAGWESFQGFDTYVDDGTSGTDTIQAIGSGDVDIGLTRFTAASGIEVVDASSAAGTVRLLGDWNANTLDFRKVAFVGSNIVIDAGDGDDLVFANNSANTILGGGQGDRLYGLGGNDTIDGGEGRDSVSGGVGRDVLTGGTGRDTFLFDVAATAANGDTVTDFSAAEDIFALDDACYAALGGAGALAARAFWTGAAAHDADDRIIYDAATGALYYDADGNGAGTQVQIAAVGTGLGLASTNFLVV